MIGPDGLFDWAVQSPGPPQNAYNWRNSMENLYHHSMEGYLDTTGNIRWNWSVRYNGVLEQHYPVFRATPHGGPNANPFGPGGESEGIAGEPLTTEQVRTWIRIHTDMEQFTGRTYERKLWSGKGLVEHKEAPAQTSCPSGRYAPLWAAILGDDMASLEEMERAILLVGSYVAGFPDGKEYTSIPELTAYFKDFTDKDLILSLGLGQTQEKLANHIASSHIPMSEEQVKTIIKTHTHKTNQQTITTGEVMFQ